MASIIITKNSHDVYTLNPDGSEYKELVTANERKKNRIGEFKKIVMNFTSDQSLAYFELRLSPCLFSDLYAPNPFSGGAPGFNYWGYQFTDGPTTGLFPMFLNVGVGYSSDLIRNETYEIEVVGDTEFNIIITFYQIYDLRKFMNPAQEHNQAKLMKDWVPQFAILTVSGQSIYNTPTCFPRFYLFFRKTTDITNLTTKDVFIDDYFAGFYGADETNAPGYFAKPEWIIEDEGSPVTKLQLDHDTTVRFQIDAPVSVSKIDLWMLDMTDADDTVDMKTNYDASFCHCLDVAGTVTTIDNKIKSPTLAPFYVTGIGPYVFECSFHVDKTKIVYGRKYRFIAIVYYDDGYTSTYEVNSFISDAYEVELPKYSGAYGFSGKLSDYNKEFEGNELTACVEERMCSKIEVDFTSDAFSNDILDRLGIVVPNDIRRYLTQVMVEIYESVAPSTRHFMDRRVINKLDPTNYSTDSALVLDFSEDGKLKMRYDWRNRYESWVLNLQSTLGAFAYSIPQSTQDWGGRDLWVKYSLVLFYDDYVNPFSDTIVFAQKLHIRNYSQDVEVGANDGEGKIDPINDDQYFCNDEEVCLLAKCNRPDPQLYKLITTVEKSPGSITTIEENEVWVGGELVQQTTPKIASQEEDYSESILAHAAFCLASSEFFVNSPYKVSAMAKKVDEADFRTIKDGNFRTNKNGLIRTIK